jgi:N-carbamoylputrescine amidase
MGVSLKVALIQQHAKPDIQNNIERGVDAFKRAASQGAGLVIFPELAFTPFFPQRPAKGVVSQLAETIPGPTVDLFCRLAKEFEVVTVLNLFERDGEKTYDSSPVIDADGSVLGVTRMVHICETPCFHEQGYYYPGPGKPLVYDTAVGKIGVAICYDRHFPEYMRQLGIMKADVVAVPQAGAVDEWPEGLFEAEMQVAGFQNGYFTALCNRVGQEECVTFEGKSLVTSPDGQIIKQAPSGQDATLMVDIDLDHSNRSQARNHFFPDRRPELYSTWLDFKK